MQDLSESLDRSFAEMSKENWLTAFSEQAARHGAFRALGSRHFASFIKGSDTLVITFESQKSIQRFSEDAHPLGWEMAKLTNCSTLNIVSDGLSWFRERQIFAYFDELSDQGFFEEFDDVCFFGAGACGYAAGAYSIAAPGARVLLLHPQATLSPSVADWETRFTNERRQDFTSRYGYAPDMIDGAQEAFVVYDPQMTEDAMHAALFTRPNVTKLRMRHQGGDLLGALASMGSADMDCVHALLLSFVENNLTKLGFAKLMRERRESRHYLRQLLKAASDRGSPQLIRMMLKNVTRRFDHLPAFERRLEAIEQQIAQQASDAK